MSAVPLVIDSSVAVKWVKPHGERHVREATALLDGHETGELVLVAPAHLLLEVMNALWSHHVAEQDIDRVLNDLLGLRLRIVQPDRDMLSAAAVLATRHRITVYDAVFAALAEQLDCELVTDDRALAKSGACRTRALG